MPTIIIVIITLEGLINEVSEALSRSAVDGGGHLHQQQLLQLHQRFLVDAQRHKLIVATFHHGFDLLQLVQGPVYLVFHCQWEQNGRLKCK